VLELLYFPTLIGSRSRWRRVLQRFTVCCGVLQYVAICCSVLQCVECLLQCIVALVAVCYCTRKRGGQQRKLKPLVQSTHCNTLQHTAPHCNTLQRTAPHCNILQRTALHCNTLQHTANTLQHTALQCNTLPCTARQCNTPHRTATHCNALQHVAIQCRHSNCSGIWHTAGCLINQTYECAMSHIWMSHVAHINTSCHTYGWVM